VISPDVNVLVCAARDDAPRHPEYRAWLDEALAAQEPMAISELVRSGVLRVLTNPRVFNPPLPMIDAAAYVGALRDHPRVVPLRPGARH